MSDIRLQYLWASCSYCTQMALHSIRHRWLVCDHDTWQVGLALYSSTCPLSRLSRVFILDLRPRGSMCGTSSRVSSRWGVFGGVEVMSLVILICPLAIAWQTDAHCSVGSSPSTCPSHRFSRVFISEPRTKGRKYGTFSRVSSRWGVKTGPECCGRDIPSFHIWWHRVLYLNDLDLPRSPCHSGSRKLLRYCSRLYWYSITRHAVLFCPACVR